MRILLLLGLMHAAAFGESFAGHAEMNGIQYSQYSSFEAKWKMITVRYRTDNSEQRFVYANPLAEKVLNAGAIDYPDGAVFAKIGFMTAEDPAFKSSRVPSGSLRYQFMVRDRKKYAATGGWGYALFDANKVTFEGDFAAQAQACYACHQLVTARGQVFSTPMKISAFVGPAMPVPEVADADLGVVRFSTVGVKALPEILRKSLPAVKSVRSVQGEITKHVFRGTIDEIRPTLVEEAKKSGLPAVLIGADQKQFSAVYPDKPRTECAGRKSLKAVFSTSVPSSAPGASPYTVVAWQDLCG